MAREASAQREKQDQSIKARKNELFVGETEVQTGPRKRLRDYVRETPAAPLSRNVKLILWGSAAPVALLFVLSLVTGKSHATAPTESVIPVHRAKLAAPPVAKVSDHKSAAPEPDAAKPPKEARAGDQAKDEKPPQEKKEKAKKKGGGKNKGKAKAKKDDTTVAQNDTGDKTTADEANTKGGDAKKNKAGDAKKTKGGSDKTAGKDSSDSDSMKNAPPKKRAAPLFKKKKDPVFTYPKRDGEKKADPNAEPGAGDITP